DTPLVTISRMHNVIILGSGCAGNTAAIYTARAGLKPLVIIGHEPGGQLSITTEVENFPGFPEGINGPDLVENMKKQAERFGAEITLVHRREEFRASKIMLDRARANPKIKWLPNTVVEDIHDVSKNIVTSVKLHDLKTGKIWEQDVSGFFVAIGHIPNTKPF